MQHMDTPIGTHGEGGTDGFLALLDAQRYGDNLCRGARFLETDGLFDGNLVERIHGHLDVGELDPGLVRFDTNLDVVVDDPFDGHENLHGDPGIDFSFNSGTRS